MDKDSVIDHIKTDFLYNQLPSGFISYKPNGKILRVNETFTGWLGLPVAEVCKLNFRAVLTKASGLYYSMVIDPILNLQGKADEIYLTFITARGEIDTLLNAVSYKDDDGNVILINATVQKITDRKKYEAALLQEKRHAEEEKRKFEFLSNSVPNLIWTTAADGTCKYVNQRIVEYYGEQSLDFYSSFAGVANQDKERSMLAWQKCVATGKTFERELRLIGVSGAEEWFLVSIVPYFNQDGEIESWFGSAANIHKQKVLQVANYSSLSDSLTTAQQTLDENKKLFNSIALNQSHMIRKPLANIIGLLNLINEDELCEGNLDLLALIGTSVQELDEMIKAAANYKASPEK